MITISKFNFNDLFVLDLANNHQGELNHGIKIINSLGKIVNEKGVRAALKFQFRDLDTLIHPSFNELGKDQQIDRFISTKLSESDFNKLFETVRSNKMITMCTPFDERSVDKIIEMKFDLIKVASCSAKDWPLLNKVAKSNLPVIISSGGLSISEIDDVVSFFQHKGCDFAIMHCVSIYPTPDNKCNLNQIDVLMERYKNIPIGWSTHEDPGSNLQIAIAVAKGAKMFERHVGIENNTIKLNKYSSTPQQIDEWFDNFKKAKDICGSRKREIDKDEVEALNKLKRGVYLKNKKNNIFLNDDDVFFALPFTNNQLSSGEWKNNIKLNVKKSKNDPIVKNEIILPPEDEIHQIKKAIHEVKALLNKANVILNDSFEVEYSHHYGVKNFKKFGAVIINCINRDYCKKIVVQLPGQFHPYHFHKLKEETFQLLYGDLTISLDGKEKNLTVGETCLV